MNTLTSSPAAATRAARALNADDAARAAARAERRAAGAERRAARREARRTAPARPFEIPMGGFRFFHPTR
jgi:hypothetical protein